MIRDINEIRPSGKSYNDQLALPTNSSEEYNTSKQQKLNIFDEQDKGKLKKETLAKYMQNDRQGREYSAEVKSIRSSKSST